MKTETRTIYQIKVNESVVAELASVLIGRPSKIVGHTIIQHGDKDNAKFFHDYDDALTSFCSAYNVEREDVTRASYFSDVLAFPESDDEEIQGFYDHLYKLGFNVEHTGGGCTWLALYGEGDTYIAISQEADKEIRREHMQDLGVSVGLYHGDDCEGEYFNSETISGAFTLVNVLVDLKRSKIFTLKAK